jgi:predicted O-methyltransferase YrrM
MKTFASAAFRRLLSQSFPMWQALGIHITQNYFESPIPDTRCLKEETWRKRSRLTGINMREEEQIKLLESFIENYKAEYETFPRSKTGRSDEYYVDNGFFEAVDGEILYCMVRNFKPKRIYEVGCGNSTLVTARALIDNHKNGDPPGQLVAFEPSPNKNLTKGLPGLSRLVVSKVEDVPLTVFQELEENDILFLDSSHVVRIGGDVQYEFLEILPNLKPGVIVHVHDIFLPAEYPRGLAMQQRRFFSEQYLLQAFLTFNCKFQVLWAGSFMHLNHPELLERAFNSYKRESRWPGSFWMQRVGH